jgi:predicted nucleic acid-binding protein
VDLLRGNEESLKKLAEMEAGYGSLSTTEINVLELYRGAYLSIKVNQNLEKVREILECFQILDLDSSSYEVFASLSASLLLKGRPIGAFDELIAAIILSYNEKIVTRYSRFKEVPGLEVIDY